MIENGFYLPSLDAGEPFQKLLNRCAIFEILEERGHGNPGATKYPSPADLVRIALNGIASFPVCHIITPLLYLHECNSRNFG